MAKSAKVTVKLSCFSVATKVTITSQATATARITKLRARGSRRYHRLQVKVRDRFGSR